MKLGTLLLRNAAIGLSQLEAALRNQVLYGGRLGTNLVELGHLDLEQLSTYLAELSGYPIATQTLLDDADPALLARLGADDAHRLRAIPLGFLGDARDTAAVAFVDPDDTPAAERVAARLGVRVAPYIVPELRALYYLEKHYGLPRRARFLRPGQVGPEAVAPERRRTQPTPGVIPPALTLEPRRKRDSASASMPLSIAVGGSGPPPGLSFTVACERIDGAPHREKIAEVLVEYGKGRCDALVVFLIRDGNAVGWRGYAAPPGAATLLGAGNKPTPARGVAGRTPIEELSLPLGGGSSLQSAHDTGQAYVGPPPANAHPVETRLWLALGTSPEPKWLIVVPILVKQRPVNLVYAHVRDGVVPQQIAAELGELAERAQASYLRLIRAARGS